MGIGVVLAYYLFGIKNNIYQKSIKTILTYIVKVGIIIILKIMSLNFNINKGVLIL